MHEAKRRRGISSLRMILIDWRSDDGSVPDVRSEFEALVLPRLVARGLPRPICNKTLQIDEERLMVDFLWEEQRVVVETDGEGNAWHAGRVSARSATRSDPRRRRISRSASDLGPDARTNSTPSCDESPRLSVVRPGTERLSGSKSTHVGGKGTTESIGDVIRRACGRRSRAGRARGSRPVAGPRARPGPRRGGAGRRPGRRSGRAAAAGAGSRSGPRCPRSRPG